MSTDKNDLTYIDFDCKWQCCYRQPTDHIDDFVNVLFSNESDDTRQLSLVKLPHIVESITQDNENTYRSYGWCYRKQFDWVSPDKQLEHQVYLIFDSSNDECDSNTSDITATIWLNNEKICSDLLLTQQQPIELTDKLLRSCEVTEENRRTNVLIVYCVNTSLSLHARLIVQGTVVWATGQVKTNGEITSDTDNSNLKKENDALDYAVRVSDADSRIGVVFNNPEEEIRVSQSSSSLMNSLHPIIDDIQPNEKNEILEDVPVPRLSIVILIVGTRGDVQPFIALGQALLVAGHRVRLATHETFRAFVRDNGLEFFPLAGDPADLMSFMVKNAGIIPSVSSIVAGDVAKKRRVLAEILASTWLACTASDDETMLPFTAEAIIANPPSFGHIHCAEKLQIPLHIMFTMPWTPTTAFPHPLCNIDSSRGATGRINFYSYHVVEMLTWSGMRGIVNDFRKKILGLSSMRAQQATNVLIDECVPHTYCWSPSLVPKPPDWEAHIDVSGFFFLDLGTTYTDPPQDLLDFLGMSNDHQDNPILPAPIYIGFGSITGHDCRRLLGVVIDALNKTGYRALLSGLAAETDQLPENVFKIGNVPHDWLFQHVSAVCHHGGAGTTAAGLRAGKPTIIVPFFGDQFFWGNVIEKSGAGSRPLPGKSMTASELAEAFQFAHQLSTRQAAKRLRTAILKENGCEAAVRAFHVNLPISRMRSHLESTFAACYRIDRLNIQISRPVAHALVAAGVIDVSQLRAHHMRIWPLKRDRKNEKADDDLPEQRIKSPSFSTIDSDIRSNVTNNSTPSNSTRLSYDDTNGTVNNYLHNFNDLSLHSATSYSKMNDILNGCPSVYDNCSEHHANHESDVTDPKKSIKTAVLSMYHIRKSGFISFLKRSRTGHQPHSKTSNTADALIAIAKCAMQPAVCSVLSPAPWCSESTQNTIKPIDQTDETESQPESFDITSLSSISSEQEHKDCNEISPTIKAASAVSGFSSEVCQEILREFDQLETKQEQALNTLSPEKQYSKPKHSLQRQRSHSISAIN